MAQSKLRKKTAQKLNDEEAKSEKAFYSSLFALVFFIQQKNPRYSLNTK